MLKRVMAICLLVFCSLGPVWSQSSGSKDPRAITLLNATVSALVIGVNVTNVALTGTVTRTADSDLETGSATLEALGGGESRINLTLTAGQRSEVINQSQGAPAGQWSGPDGTVHAMASHNCWAPASWFFPALALGQAANDPSMAITYIGQETRDSVVVQHIRFWHLLQNSNISPKLQARLEALNAVDVYLDAANSLPVELDFNLHPDSNAAVNIAVEVLYSNYQGANGIFLPEHIKKLINNSLFLDLRVTKATVNTNFSTADFAITAVAQ
jgi:hypothetical protein